MASIDPGSKVPIAIPYDHYRIHAAQTFEVSRYFAAVGDSASAEFAVNITATASEVHAYISYSASGGPVIAYLYEEHTATNAGTALQARNLNRAHGVDTCTSVWTYTPTAATTGAGTITIGATYNGAATTQQTKLGAALRSDEEVILSPGKKYLMRVENRSGGAINILMDVEFYEVD